MLTNTHSEKFEFQNEYTKLVMNTEGRITSLIDQSTGQNYLAKEDFFVIAKGTDTEYLPVKATVKDTNILFELENSKNDKVEVEIGAAIYPNYLVFEIKNIRGTSPVSEVNFANISTSITENISPKVNACYNNNFAVCIMALTVPVECVPEQNVDSITLTAKCYARFGIENNKFAMIASPSSKLLEVVQEVEKDQNLPCPYLGGKWGKASEYIRRSYLFVRDLTEDNVGQVIDLVKQMNAGMIMMESAVWSKTLGHYHINKSNFPRGMDGLKYVVDEMHRAGIKAGLHFLPVLINDSDPYVTPVPDERLIKDGEAVLITDITEITNKINCEETIAESSAFPEQVVDAYRETGLDILVEDEIIHYKTKKVMESIDGKEHMTLEECIRGTYGTKAASHKPGTKIYHLRRVFGEFQADLDTTLIDEITTRIADVVNYCGFDMVYFDGSERLQQVTPKQTATDFWYHNAKLHYDFCSKFIRNDILLQASSHSHYSWHMMCRTAIADGFRDIKRSLDSNLKRIEAAKDNFMPVDIGWYALGASNISYDDIEYILCRSIGFDSSVGFQVTHLGETIKIEDLLKNPEVPALIDMIGKYETLRLSNYFDEETKAMLRIPGIDYKLIQDTEGHWSFIKKQL